MSSLTESKKKVGGKLKSKAGGKLESETNPKAKKTTKKIKKAKILDPKLKTFTAKLCGKLWFYKHARDEFWPRDAIGNTMEQVHEGRDRVKLVDVSPPKFVDKKNATITTTTTAATASTASNTTATVTTLATRVFIELNGKKYWPTRLWFKLWNDLCRLGVPGSGCHDWTNIKSAERGRSEQHFMVYIFGFKIIHIYGFKGVKILAFSTMGGPGWYKFTPSHLKEYGKALDDFAERLANYNEEMHKHGYELKIGKKFPDNPSEDEQDCLDDSEIGFYPMEVEIDEMLTRIKNVAKDERETLGIESDSEPEDEDENGEQDSDDDGDDLLEMKTSRGTKESLELRKQARELIEKARELERSTSEARKHARRFETGQSWVNVT